MSSSARIADAGSDGPRASGMEGGTSAVGRIEAVAENDVTAFPTSFLELLVSCPAFPERGFPPARVSERGFLAMGRSSGLGSKVTDRYVLFYDANDDRNRRIEIH